MSNQNFQDKRCMPHLLLRSATRIFARFLVITLAPLLLAAELQAQEVISQEEPTPASVDEITTPIERSFIERIPRPGFFPWLKEQLKDTPAFFS